MIKSLRPKLVFGFRWLLSFIRPQVLRKNITNDGTVVPFPRRASPGVLYRSYLEARYELVGQVRSPRDDKEILYRFRDCDTGKEFNLTEGLKDLLLYRERFAEKKQQ